MKYFFATAAEKWDHSKFLKRFELSGGESISCVLWDDVFFITGTDIVRSLTFRFHAFGRPVTNAKKFEEGIFSDLRNLKPGQDARLEEPKSELLDMLYKNNCIRTQKKQKVFYWYSVPHDRLFLDALERDLKREKVGLEPTTKPVAEPATSLSIDSTQELFDQLRKNMANSVINSTTQSIERNEIILERAAAAAQAKRSRVNSVPASLGQQQQLQLLQHRHHRMSHNSYFSGTRPPSTSRPRSTTTTTTAATRPLSSSASSLLSSPVDEAFFRDDASTTTTLTDMSKSNLSSPLSVKQLDSFIDPIANGVHQLEIISSVSNTSTASSILSHAVMPSQSFDANAMKKTKAIFGNLPLFDGAPTYKQRRRRAASVSTSALLNSQHLLHATTTGAGGPERVRRHDKCHLRTTSSATNNNGIPPQTLTYPPHATATMLNNGSSRLALAATKAGFAFPGTHQTHAMPAPSLMPTLMTTQSHGGWPGRSQQQQDFYCPLPECGHMFKRQDHLERHIQSLHIFLCTLCGKQFHSAENLTQHHRLEHGLHQYDPAYSLSHDGDDDRDGDSSDNHKYNVYQRSSQQFLNHTTTTNAANH
ncbi:MAG: STE like transcription factor-domain-containing protein, partial [Benjaminiella poitrasii]